MLINVMSEAGVSGGHIEYMARNQVAKDEGDVRALFSSTEDKLSRQRAFSYLSNDNGRPRDGAGFELVVSIDDKNNYNSLHLTNEGRKEQLRAVIREGMTGLLGDLGVDARWVAAIHLNTENPHVHIVVASDCKSLTNGKARTLKDIPQAWKIARGDEPSRAASHFEPSFRARQLPRPPESVRTIPASYVIRDEMPTRARGDLFGVSAQQQAYSYLLDEREITPALVQSLLDNGSLYAGEYGQCVFVNRDAEGNAVGATTRSNVVGQGGQFYIGNLQTATRFILVDSPVEALSLYDLNKGRELSNACFVALNNEAPTDELLSQIAARGNRARVVWARGLDESGAQNIAHFDETKIRLAALGANAVEYRQYAPKPGQGNSWNAQLSQSHLQGEIATIEQNAEARAQGGAVEPVAEVSAVEEVAAEIGKPTTVEVIEAVAVEPRTIADVLTSLPVIQTQPAQPDILNGTRAFNMREAARAEARTKREQEDSAQSGAATAPEANGKRQSIRVETEVLRNTSVVDVLHAHGLRLSDRRGEKVYTDSLKNFALKVTGQLFSNRKDGDRGGAGAIDLVMYLQGTDFASARGWLTDNFHSGKPAKLKERPALREDADEPKPLRLPPANSENLNTIRAYLTGQRGLASEIVEACIANGTLYANSMGSAVFIHRDPQGHTTGAEWRSTDSNLRGTVGGTEKQFGWFYVGDMNTATRYVVAEAPIDILSYVELHKDTDVSRTCFLSLNGASMQKSLIEYIAKRAAETDVELVWALDNNPVGKKSQAAADKSFARAMETLTNIETGLLVNVSKDIPQTKDWNDDLLSARGLLQVEPQAQDAPQLQDVDESISIEVALADVAPVEAQAEERPDDIISVRQRESILRDWEVNFKDGRFRFIGHADNETDARQEARNYREALEARGTQINNVGVYVEGIETVRVKTPKNFGIEIEVVQDVVDGHWRAAHDFSHPSGGASGPVSLFSQSYATREQAILSITVQASDYFEKLGRTSDSKGIQQAARGILRNIAEFESQFAQGALLEARDEAAQIEQIVEDRPDAIVEPASTISDVALPEAGEEIEEQGEGSGVVAVTDEPPSPDGWILRKDDTNNRTSYYLRSMRFKGYQISLYRSESDSGKWHGEILTRQRHGGVMSWEPARNGFNGAVEQVIAEAEKRGLYWETKNPNKRAVLEAATVAPVEFATETTTGAANITGVTEGAAREEQASGANFPEKDERHARARELQRKFEGVSTADLIERIERAADFDYTDEGEELTNRIALNGKAWRWTQAGAVVGVANSVEIYELQQEREVNHEREVTSDRESQTGDAGVPREVGADGNGLLGGTEAEGVRTTDGSGHAQDSMRDDDSRDGENVAVAFGTGRGINDGVGDRGTDNTARLAGVGGLGTGSDGGRSGVGSDEPVRQDTATSPTVTTVEPETVFAKIVSPDNELISSKSKGYEEAQRAVEAQGMAVVARYVRGNAEGIEAARRMLESIGSTATLEVVTEKYELVLARTAGRNEVEMTREEYIARRHALSIRSHERGIENNRAEIEAMGGRVNKRRGELERQISWWTEVVSDPERHLERSTKKYGKDYDGIVCKAISQGVAVAPEIMEQSPAFRTARTNRERYEKGRNTSFANRSAAIDDSMQSERGYKVKRQDGKAITDAQIAEIAAGMDEIENVLGSCAELMRTGDLTFAHTNGKHPFLSNAGGLYHTNERTISIGIRSKFTGRPIPSQAHEFFHWLDNEAGIAEGVSITRWGKSRQSRRTYSYLSEGDNDYRSGGRKDGGLIEQARKLINNQYEIERLLSNRTNKKASQEELIEKELVRVSLGSYWRESCEIWARLGEQYIATKQEGNVEHSARPDYTKTIGYWKREDFEKLMPLIEEQIERRLSIVRAALTPEAAQKMGAVDVTQELDVRDLVKATEAVQEHRAPVDEAATIHEQSAEFASQIETSFSAWLRERGDNPQRFEPNRDARPSDRLLIEEGNLRVEHMAAMKEAGVVPADVDEDTAAHRGRIEKNLPGYVKALERDYTGVHTIKSVGTKQFLLGALSALDSLDRKAEGARNVVVANTIAEDTRPADALTEETEIPASVIRQVEFHLQVLRTAEAQLIIGQEADRRIESGTRYEDETWEKYREECLTSRGALTEFITKATQNDVDGTQVIDELGGFPQIIKARMMRDDAHQAVAGVPAVTIIDAANVEESAGSAWVRGDWPEINEDAFYQSPSGNEDTDPYMILNVALRTQRERRLLIPLAEQALEEGIDPATGKKFTDKARKAFRAEYQQIKAFYISTFDQVDSTLGLEAGRELRRRVEASDARNREQLINDYVQELSPREEVREIVTSAVEAESLVRLTRHVAELVEDGLSNEPSPVEAAEYNIASVEGFALEVARGIHESVRRIVAESAIEPVEVDATGARERARLLEERAEAIARLACERVGDSLTMYGATGAAIHRITKDAGRSDEEIAAEIASYYKPKPPEPVRADSRQRNRNEAQGSLFGEPERAEQVTPSAPSAPAISEAAKRQNESERITEATVYRSGVSSVTDLRAYINASAPVGVVAGRLSAPAIAELVEYNRAGGSVFLDSGAFGARNGGSVDFQAVIDKYDLIFLQMDEKGKVALVMPDVVGDQQRSLELVAEHRDSILFYIEQGADTLIPIQRGELSLSNAYNKIVETLGTNNFRVAIPSNQKAVPQDELITFLRESKPERIHLLGISDANRRFDPLVEAIQEALPEVELSADANRLRALIGRNRKLTEAVTERLDEYAHLAVLEGDVRLQVEDETEAINGIYNTPRYFSDELAEAFARYITSDPEQQRRIYEVATDPEPAAALSTEEAAEIDEFEGIECVSKLGYVLEDIYPGDRAYREAIYQARKQMALDALKQTEVPAQVRGEELTRIETESRAKEIVQEASALDKARETYRTWRNGLDTADAWEAEHFDESFDLLRTNPEMLVDVLDTTIVFLGEGNDDAVATFKALRDEAARELSNAPASTPAELTADDIAQQRAAMYGTTKDVVLAATAAFYNAEDDSTRLPNATGSESLADYINYYKEQAELSALRASMHQQLTDLEAIDPATLRAGDKINLFGENDEHIFELTVTGRDVAGRVQVEFTPDETGRIKLFTDSPVAREWLESIEEQGRDGGFAGSVNNVHTIELDVSDPRVRQWDFDSLPDSRVSVTYAGYSAQEIAQEHEETATEEPGDAASVEEMAEPPKSKEPNYIITDVHLHDEGLKTRFKNNVAAIETLRLIESEDRAATPDEKEELARYSGWGAMPGAFNRYGEDAGNWTKERDILQHLLTPEEWDAASRSTLNAHYTHPMVVDALWRATTRMGFEGGRVLEPAMGIGTFFGRVPEGLRDKVQFTGVELDGLTGRMARLLYPQATVHIKGFQEVNAPDNWFDLVISNVPFGDYPVHDPDYNKHKANIHDYFFLKSLDKVREGGLVVCISSTFTMDKQQTAIRETLAGKADLVAAIRLPNDAFKSNAGTEVVTDIIMLQKRASLERRLALAEKELRQKQEISSNLEMKLTRATQPDVYLDSVVRNVRDAAEIARKQMERAEQKVEHLKAGGTNNVAWTQIEEVEDPEGGAPIPVNEYYAARPYMIMGMLDRTGTMYHAGNVTVHLDGRLDELLFDTISANIPRDIYEPQGEDFEAGGIERIVTDDSIKAGGYVIQEGKLYQRVKNVLVEREADAETMKRAEKMLGIRDCVRRVFDAELKGEMSIATEARQDLNRQYDRFANYYGPLHLPKNQQTLAGDPDLHVLLALESKFTPKSGNKQARATKADIFSKPTLRSYERPASADGLNEAISITLNEYGRLNLDRVTELLGQEHGEIETELRRQGLAYQNPRTRFWQMRDDYLSGNVRAKLIEAREASLEDERFAPNVAALEAVQPADIDYVDIGARLGSSWIPATDVADFMAHLVGGSAEDFTVKYAPLTGSWGVGYTPSGASKHRFKPAAVEIWGTGRADLIDVAQHALDSRAVIIRDKVAKDTYVINKEETEAANAKVATVKAEFKEWLWTDPDRRARLHRYYNDNFNNIVEKQFDGSHLTFPGMATEIDGKPFKLREHQVNAVWRMVTTGKAVFGHEVGTGKTYTMVAAAMELKRLSLSEKPAITCLKANIEQITNDARKLYPGARILSTLGNFDKADRKNMVARMATGDYDLIILTHDNIDMLPMFPETRAKYIKEELKELEEVIAAAEMNSSGNSKRGNRLVKSLEKSKAKLEADMLEILEKNKDDAVNFEQTGIDCLFVDEAHKYKSLKVITRQDRVKGIPTGRSDRATNMLARVRWLQEQHGGRGVAFATGTPIANSTAELFNLQRYLQWEELNERGLRSFDAWASVFGETVTKIEKTATGNYKEVTRFAKFTNQSELLQMVGMVMDVKLAKDMPNVLRPSRSDEVVQSELSDEQHTYQIGLQIRAEDLKGKYIREKGADNMLAISNDARKLSLDMRLVDPTATDNPDSKVNKCVSNVLEIAKAKPDVTQMIFSDIGVHKNDYGFSVYDDIIEKLVAGGIERDQIINFAALTETQRKGAIDRLARGEAKVALGSTDKLGTGVNAQQHLYAAHNLDVPWLPAYVTQRDGRIWRQGNKHEASGEPIKIYRYVTVGGFDELMWQTVDRKLQFINDIMEGKTNGVREVMEVDGEELTAAQIAAIASGNPDVLRKVELEDSIGELERAERRHTQSQLRLADDALEIGHRIERHERVIETLTADNETYKRGGVDEEGNKIEDFSAEVMGRQFNKRKDAALALETEFSRARNGDVLGHYKGFPITSRTGNSFGLPYTELYLAGQTEGGYELNFATAEGAFASMDAALRGIERRIAANQEQINVLNINVEKISGEVGKKFKDSEQLTILRAELVEVNARLLPANENKKELNLANGKISFEEVNAEVYLRNAGVVKELRELADEGGTIIKIDNTPVGWLKQTEDGRLEAIEINEDCRRKGVATRAIIERFEGKPFTSLSPNEQGKALLDSIGQVERDEDGYAHVTPLQNTAGSPVIVGYQTRVHISAEEQILAEYPEVTDAAMQGFNQQTGREMSAEGRMAFARILMESAAREPSEQQLEMIETLSEEAGDVTPPKVNNELEAAAYIASQRTDIAGEQIWVRTALMAEQEASQSRQKPNTSDVGRFHRGNGADRSYGISVALDMPFTRKQSEGREVIDVKFVAVEPENIFDPEGLISGTDKVKSHHAGETLASRLTDANMNGNSDRTAKARTEILKEFGYEAEARRMDGKAGTKLRELIVFELEALKPIERSVEPQAVMQRLPEWRERAEKTHRLESDRPARVISGYELVARLKLQHAEHCHIAAVEQTDLRRYKVQDVDGDERRISVRDIELRAKAIAHREVARQMPTAMDEQARLPVGSRKPGRIVRQELQDEVIRREMERHEATIIELQGKHEEVIEKLQSEVERARSSYELAAQDAVEEAAKDEYRLPEPIITAATLNELHDDAVDRGDAETITLLDRLRQRLIRDFGPEAERDDHAAGRLGAQHRMAELNERVTKQTLERFEQSYHLRRFDIEGRDRHDYLPEQRGAQNQQHEKDEQWSLKDVAKAQQTVARSREWLLKNAEHFDKQASFKTLFDQTLNPLNEVKAQIRFISNPMQAMENHLPHRMLLNHPAVQSLRFVLNYNQAKEQADECRRLADLEEQKLEDLAEIRDEVTEKIALKRGEIKLDLAQDAEMSKSLKSASNNERFHRLLNRTAMPDAIFEEHEIRRLEANAMELRDGPLLQEYETLAQTAKATDLLEEEDLAARSIGRETTAEARLLAAEARLAALSQPVAAANAVATAEQVLTVKDLTMVRASVGDMDHVMSLRDAATAPEEVREAVEQAVEQHEARLVTEVAQARDFHDYAKDLADSYRSEIELACQSAQAPEPQFTVKQHLEIEQYAAGVEDDALHARFSEIADSALTDGRVIGIEKSLSIPPEQTPLQAESLTMQTAEFEHSITAADSLEEARAGFGALERAANSFESSQNAQMDTSIGGNGNGNGHGPEVEQIGQRGIDMNSPTTQTALEMDDATIEQAQLAEAEAAEIEESAAIDFLIL